MDKSFLQGFATPYLVAVCVNRIGKVHGLYAASLILGITSIIGVVIAYMKRNEAAGTIYASHLDYAIRTFWIGLAMGLAGFILSFLIIGVPVLMFTVVWFSSERNDPIVVTPRVSQR